ncbi:MAG: MFS transporter [Candidatus Bathyarchaeia archaeon]
MKARDSTSTAERPKELGLKNVANLGIVSMFTDISTEMILGVLPIYVITQLGGTKELLGLMEGAAEFLNYMFRVFSGAISDRLSRRKPLILLGYGLSTAAKPLFAIATSWSGAFVVRLTDRAGKGIRTSPRDALISESVKEAKSGTAFGLHQSADQVGAVLGPVLAFLLLPLYGARGIFWISLIPGALSLIVLAFWVQDRRGTRTSTPVLRNAKAVLTKRFEFFLLVMGVFALGAYNFSFILVKASALGASTEIVTLVYATLNVATVVVGFPSGILSDRFGKEKFLAVSFGIFFVASLAGLLSTEGVLLAFVIAFIYGAYIGISEALQRALVPSLVSAELKGTGYSVYYLVIGTCSLIANLVFGVLSDQFSMGAAFTYSLLTCTLGIIGMLAFIISKPKT